RIESAVSVTSTTPLANNVEVLFLTGTNITGTGNALSNLIRGSSGDNPLAGGSGTAIDILEGAGGGDTLTDAGGNTLMNGGAGNDTLTSGASSDLLIGGTGTDTLAQGAGADII